MRSSTLVSKSRQRSMRDETVTQGVQGSKSGDDTASSSHVSNCETGTPVVRVRGSSPGPNEWHPDGIDSKLLHASHSQASSTALSSLIIDNGDGQQLSDNAQERNGAKWAPNDFSDQVEVGYHLGLGSQFSPSDVENIKRNISDSSLSDYNDVPLTWETKSKVTAKSRQKTLQDRISEARVKSLDKGNLYLPLDDLGTLITPESIQKELLGKGLKPTHNLPSIAEGVLKITPGKKPEDCTTTRKIFATLVMMRKSDAIVHIQKEGIYDHDLPFQISNQPGVPVYRRKRKGKAPIPIRFFDEWEIDQKETFDQYQWQMTSPYFKLSYRPGKTVTHYILEPQVVLPFIEETHNDSSSGRSLDISGGTSTVRKLKIHRAHHNLSKRLGTNPYFAVKTLRISEELAKQKGKEVDREALALKRFVDKDHDHLIRLLATFSHKDQFHLIFPCADGNLHDFWKLHPNLTDLQRKPELGKWLVGQLHGLACAVRSIHRAPVDDATSSGLDKAIRDKEHGRHGDLKPENILWFRESANQSGQSPMGVLKITDFGFADFHRTHSVNIISFSAVGGMTPTYRAPEYDIAPNAPKQGLVSPAYDIWSFGCVILEFITWYLLGWDGVDAFSTNRKHDSSAILAEDNFFNSEQNGRIAKSKRSVAEHINTLKEHPDCKDFLLNLLDFIQDGMLRMMPQCRTDCDKVVSQFEKIKNECDKNSDYLTERVYKILRTSTDLSVVAVQYTLPEPGQPQDPINVVNATILDRPNTREQETRRQSLASVVYTTSRTRRSTAEVSVRTPLLSNNNSVSRAPSDYEETGKMGIGAVLYQGTVNWALGIFNACCCVAGDAH
ncbi:kinase-like protein [Decorospora gaudefroyi]|uniref:Kinase-like protein n=1 Tax=Decorospora gaudefroyi TaxID=184978 RepID=A0A6A5KE11_9PLEO|nr:kinase-like protein [Decorospora gaudefroyi]